MHLHVPHPGAAHPDPDLLAEADVAIRRLDVPDCGCPFRRIPCECEAYQRVGDCDHPPTYTPPCEHVRAIDPDHFPLSFDEWRDLLHGRHPGAYAEPEHQPTPALSLTRQGRVDTLADRHTWQESLRHPGDLFREPDPDVTRRTRHLRNGRDDRSEDLDARPVFLPLPKREERERKVG